MRWNDTEKERAVAGFVLRTKQYMQSATVFPKARGRPAVRSEGYVQESERKRGSKAISSSVRYRGRCMMRENVERERETWTRTLGARASS